MKVKAKPTDKTFSVGLDLHIPKLKKLKEYLHKHYKNNYNFPPHVGIAMTAINPKKVDKAFEYVLSYFKPKKAFTTSTSNIIYYKNRVQQNNTMVQLDLNGSELPSMHKEILSFLSQNYKENYVREKDFERIKNNLLDEKSKDYVLRYGFSHVMDLFKPHITVANLLNEYVTDSLKEKIEKDLKGIANSVVEIKNIHIIYHTSPKIQTDTKVIRREDIVLP